MHSSGVIQSRLQLYLGGVVKKKIGKVALSCDPYSAEALALILNAKQLYDSNPHECCQFLVKYKLLNDNNLSQRITLMAHCSIPPP